MEAEREARLKALMSPWCPVDLVTDLLGIDLVVDPKLLRTVRSWAGRFRDDERVDRGTNGEREMHRHALEAFLLQNGLISWKWAAIYCGLETQVLKDVVDHLERRGDVLQVRSDVSDQLVRRREAASLIRAFPSWRNQVFTSHGGMCIALHHAIASELHIEFKPVHCVTSEILEPRFPDVAVAFDAITMDPVGLRYQVWLDTKKPVSLAADVCSLKFYAENQAALRPYVMQGGEPERIPDELRVA
jgi:hypothetical protein